MKKRRKFVLASLALFGLILALAIYFILFRTYLEVRECETKNSSDGKWTAVVQMEVYSAAAFVNVAVYSVRLKGVAQKDLQGDLVMNVEVNYPHPAPSIDWSDGKLIVTLTDNQKYQYFTTPVSGVDVIVQEK